MKTVLMVLGAIAVLVVLVVAVGGYIAYKKSGSMIVTASQQEIERFISTKRPPEPVADSLRRMINAVKLQRSSMAIMMLAGAAMGTIQDGVVTDEESKMLNEGAQLAEQGEVPKEKLSEFMMKYGKLMPHKGNHP